MHFTYICTDHLMKRVHRDSFMYSFQRYVIWHFELCYFLKLFFALVQLFVFTHRSEVREQREEVQVVKTCLHDCPRAANPSTLHKSAFALTDSSLDGQGDRLGSSQSGEGALSRVPKLA